MEPSLSLRRLLPLFLSVIFSILLLFSVEIDGSVIPKPAEDRLNSVLDLLNSAKASTTASAVVPPAVIPPVIPEPVGDHLSSMLSLLHSATASAVVPSGPACPVPDPVPDVTPAPPLSSAVAPAPPPAPVSTPTSKPLSSSKPAPPPSSAVASAPPPAQVSTPTSKPLSSSKTSQSPTLTTSTKSSTNVAESLSPQPTSPIHALSIVADFRVKGDYKDTFTWAFFYTPYGQAVGCRRNYAISVEEPMKYSPDTCKLGGTFDMVLYGKSCTYKNNGHSTGKLFCGDQTISCKKDVNNPEALQGALNPLFRSPVDDGNVVSEKGALRDLYWIWYDNPGQYSCGDDKRVPMFTCEW